MRIKETETPSKKAATIFSSMKLSTGNVISHTQSSREDTTMLDVDEEKNSDLNIEVDMNPQYVLACSGKESLDNEPIMCSIEHQRDENMLRAQSSQSSEEIAKVCPDHPSIPTSYNSMEKSRKKYTGGPADPNGRFKGRKLVLWHSMLTLVSS